MKVRKYGKSPYRIAVLHGGPGAPGYMAPVARELSRTAGILEPLQSANSLDGQIDELKDQLTAHGDLPVTLIGSSWGAVLALFAAARHRELVKKLILVGSAVFDAESSASIEERRLSRLSEQERRRYRAIMEQLDRVPADERNRLMDEWGELVDRTDLYDPITRDLEVIEVRYDIFAPVWADFVALRDHPGKLHTEFSAIDLPTVVIHGEYDPHPIDGIRPFLETCLDDIRFFMLPRCGHYPWVEKHASARFYDLLRREL